MHPDQRLLAEQALSHYGLAPAHIALIQSDRQLLFRVCCKESYALRIYPGGHPGSRAVRAQCQWLRAILRDTDLVVPQPIANRDGDDVTLLDNRCYCTLTRWVPGQRRFRATGPGARAMRQVGQLMARLHLHGITFKPPKGFVCPRWDYAGLFGKSSPWHPKRPLRLNRQTRNEFNLVLRRTQRAMQRLGTGHNVFGLIHGDLMQANFLIDHHNVHAIDFADFGRGYFLYDMAVTLLMLHPFDRSGLQRRAFIDGYRATRPFDLAHEPLLDLFIAARAVLLARWILGAEKRSNLEEQWVNQALRLVHTVTLGPLIRAGSRAGVRQRDN